MDDGPIAIGTNEVPRCLLVWSVASQRYRRAPALEILQTIPKKVLSVGMPAFVISRDSREFQ